MTWTKVDRATESSSKGWGDQTWGSSAWGGGSENAWTNQDKASSTWTDQTHPTDTWTNVTKAS